MIILYPGRKSKVQRPGNRVAERSFMDEDSCQRVKYEIKGLDTEIGAGGLSVVCSDMTAVGM